MTACRKETIGRPVRGWGWAAACAGLLLAGCAKQAVMVGEDTDGKERQHWIRVLTEFDQKPSAPGLYQISGLKNYLLNRVLPVHQAATASTYRFYRFPPGDRAEAKYNHDGHFFKLPDTSRQKIDARRVAIHETLHHLLGPDTEGEAIVLEGIMNLVVKGGVAGHLEEAVAAGDRKRIQEEWRRFWQTVHYGVLNVPISGVQSTPAHVVSLRRQTGVHLSCREYLAWLTPRLPPGLKLSGDRDSAGIVIDPVFE
jgi:hypothetical protein